MFKEFKHLLAVRFDSQLAFHVFSSSRFLIVVHKQCFRQFPVISVLDNGILFAAAECLMNNVWDQSQVGELVEE